MIHFTEGKKQKIKTTCQRCGYEWIQSERQLYRDAEITFCRSCKATESKTVMKDGWVCHPHRGEVDLDTMTPLDANGNPYLPGYRLCGMLDCTTRTHIVKAAPSKGGALYRGRPISYEQFLEIEQTRRVSK